MILVDTSGLLAALFPDQHDHEACAKALQDAEGPYLLSPFVLAELDYLIHKLAGQRTERAFLEEVAGEAYTLVPFTARDVAEALNVIDAYGGLDIGLADASLVVLANTYGVHDLLTLDQRHFRMLKGPGGSPFRLLPADLNFRGDE